MHHGRTHPTNQGNGKTADRRQDRDRRGDLVGQRHVSTAMAQAADDEQNKAQKGDRNKEADHTGGKADGDAQDKSPHGAMKPRVPGKVNPTLE